MRPSSENQGTTNLLHWIKYYLLDCRARSLADGTIEFYTKKLRQFSRFCAVHNITTINQIDPHALRAYLVHLSETGHNEGGVHGSYRVVKAFLNWYEDEEAPDNWKNPVKKIKVPRQSNELLPPVDTVDVKLILETFDGSLIGLRNSAMIPVLFDTGLRANEMLNITMDDIDAVSGAIHVMGKGKKPRMVFMSQKCRRAVRAYIKALKNKQGYLFRDRSGGRLSYQGLRSVIRRASEEAGINTPAVHAFRRGYALTMLRNG